MTSTEPNVQAFFIALHLVESSNGLRFASLKVNDQWQDLSTLPSEIADYLCIKPTKTPVGVVYAFDADVSTIVEFEEGCLSDSLKKLDQPEPGWYFCEVELPTPEPEPLPEPIPEGTPAIRCFQDLLDYFYAADRPDLLNKRIYKATNCGASISVEINQRGWIHNGSPKWDELLPVEKLIGFTIQTIVEGSEKTVDSSRFLIPCTIQSVKDWIEFMEAEAAAIWERDNLGYNSDDEFGLENLCQAF